MEKITYVNCKFYANSSNNQTGGHFKYNRFNFQSLIQIKKNLTFIIWTNKLIHTSIKSINSFYNHLCLLYKCIYCSPFTLCIAVVIDEFITNHCFPPMPWFHRWIWGPCHQKHHATCSQHPQTGQCLSVRPAGHLLYSS